MTTISDRVFISWRCSYRELYRIDFNVDPSDEPFEFEDEDPSDEPFDFENWNWDDADVLILNIDAKSHFAYRNRIMILEKIAKFSHKKQFRTQIAEELIAEVMHPRRLMLLMEQSDDFESFFDNL
jgi:hypothetical protein